MHLRMEFDSGVGPTCSNSISLQDMFHGSYGSFTASIRWRIVLKCQDMLYLNLPELLTKPGAKTSPTTTSDSLVLHHKHRLIVEGCKVNADLLTRREHLQILRNNLVRLVVVAHRINTLCMAYILIISVSSPQHSHELHEAHWQAPGACLWV